ncbi:purine-nucleoside phosphorylase, partial [Desulfovibrio sp. OttesenSCG-928-G15]|nr:purine-nucleoside phosphorylase [Desulfovibrio sp. OttesenSCG-928-G15]
FVAGILGETPVLLMRGRCHLYEGRTPGEVVTGVRVMAELGARGLVITNAVGGLNPLFPAGALMLIDDHINLTGQSPLTGVNEDSWGVRFPDMSRPYDPGMAAVMEETAMGLGIRLEKGVYACVPGPQLETRAETRALRHLGADVVGMSVVLEVIAARHLGLRVLGLSCLTNKNLPDCMGETSIEEIVATAEQASDTLTRLVLTAAPKLASFCGA